MTIYWDGLIPTLDKPRNNFVVRSDEKLQIRLNNMQFIAHLQFAHFSLKLLALNGGKMNEIKFSPKVRRARNLEIRIFPRKSLIAVKSKNFRKRISLRKKIEYFEIH